MSIEAITEALHEYKYEKLNDSPETEEEKKIRCLNKRKTKSTKDLSEKPTKFKEVDCNRCGAPNWPRQHECPARERNAQNAKRSDTMQNTALTITKTDIKTIDNLAAVDSSAEITEVIQRWK